MNFNSESPYFDLLQRDDWEIMTILKDYLKGRVEGEVYDHIITVTEVAMRIADRIGLRGESRKLVLAGALLHDVGRAITHGMDHAVKGAELLREDGFDERIVRIVERHIGAGLTAEEAESFGLPVGDYIPETIEEKIVALADNLVSDKRILKKGEYVRNIRKRFSKPEVIERHLALLEEFENYLD
jgi:uncharacterized protein (TIGR00295 family)